jgi:ribonuclease HII
MAALEMNKNRSGKVPESVQSPSDAPLKVTYPGQKWKTGVVTADRIRAFLLENGGLEDSEAGNEIEVWRVSFCGATFTYYTSGTLFCTGTENSSVVSAWGYINSVIGLRFKPPSKPVLIGLDEAGKGEIIGPVVLAGVLFPAEIYSELARQIGVADTKKRHKPDYWNRLISSLEAYRSAGLKFHTEKIPPSDVDRFNLNNLLDSAYERILSSVTLSARLENCRIVLDDYGAGEGLLGFLDSLEEQGSEVVVATNADDDYLESKLASVVAKRERERVIQEINEDEEFTINGKRAGSGNAGDRATVEWLRAWKMTGKNWPWFVRRSYKTVVGIDSGQDNSL